MFLKLNKNISLSNKLVINEFKPKKTLGELLIKAKIHNYINDKLAKLLPNVLKNLRISFIKNDTAILITDNQSVACRAQRQQAELVSILQKIDATNFINKVSIKVVANKKYTSY